MTTLLDAPHTAGADRVRWSGVTDDGRALPAGVYHVRLELGGASVTRRVVLTPR